MFYLYKHFLKLFFLIVVSSHALATVTTPLQYDDVFEIEFVSDPQPDFAGKHVAFVRNWMDRQTDRRRSTIWLSDLNGQLQALTPLQQDAHSPRWSPDNKKIAYIADQQIYCTGWRRIGMFS